MPRSNAARAASRCDYRAFSASRMRGRVAILYALRRVVLTPEAIARSRHHAESGRRTTIPRAISRDRTSCTRTNVVPRRGCGDEARSLPIRASWPQLAEPHACRRIRLRHARRRQGTSRRRESIEGRPKPSSPSTCGAASRSPPRRSCCRSRSGSWSPTPPSRAPSSSCSDSLPRSRPRGRRGASRAWTRSPLRVVLPRFSRRIPTRSVARR